MSAASAVQWRSVRPIRAVLFDLDGTFADTVGDLAAAANRTFAEEGAAAVPVERMRAVVSLGLTAILEVGLGSGIRSPRLERLRLRFFTHYRAGIAVRTRPFPGIHELVLGLEDRGIKWGIVTNKVECLARPLVQALGFLPRTGCLVCGDSLRHPKPHPQPLLHACRQLGVGPVNSIYIGDASTDVVAGRRAGVRTLIAAYGYVPRDADLMRWGAHGIVDGPLEVLDWLSP